VTLAAVRGTEMSLLTGVLPKAKNGKIKAAGQGYNPALAGIFTLLRPGTGALRGIDLSPLRRVLRY